MLSCGKTPATVENPDPNPSTENGSGNNDPNDPGNNKPTDSEFAKLISQSVEEGGTIEEGYQTITLRFDRRMGISSNATVTLNGVALKPTVLESAVNCDVEIEQGVSYTFEASEGAFFSYMNGAIKSQAITIHFTGAKSSRNTTLCDPNATESAKNLFVYLNSVYGKKILSSSIANVDWNFAEAELVYKATKKYPAIATMDYLQMYTMTSHSPFNGWVVHYDDLTEVKKWHSNNGILSACWHWNMPANRSDIKQPHYTCTPGTGQQKDGNWTTVVKPSDIMNPSSWVYPVAKEDLDKMVELLTALQNEGIALLWRPFHEASGNTYGPYAGGGAWFWWGAEGATKYKALWAYMYEYFTSRGVHNLIWVWTSQNNGDIDWYPGDKYVDIIGQDIYNQGSTANASDFKKLQATYPSKIITLSECGNVGKLSEQWSKGARWSYAMPWYQYNATTLSGHQHANTSWWQDAMSSPHVLSREDLPKL